MRILPSTSYKFCISALVLKLEMTVLVIQNCSMVISYPKYGWPEMSVVLELGSVHNRTTYFIVLVDVHV